MDSAYLQKVLGKSLVDCLAEVCLKRPSDPIEYIAFWLKNNSKNVEYNKKDAMEEAELQKQREEYRVWREKECQRRNEIERVKREEEERAKRLAEEEERLRQEMEEAAELEQEKEEQEQELLAAEQEQEKEEGNQDDDNVANAYMSASSTTIDTFEPSGPMERVDEEGESENDQ